MKQSGNLTFEVIFRERKSKEGKNTVEILNSIYKDSIYIYIKYSRNTVEIQYSARK